MTRPGEFVEYDIKTYCIYYVVASLSDLCGRLSLVHGLSVFTVLYLMRVEFGRDGSVKCFYPFSQPLNISYHRTKHIMSRIMPARAPVQRAQLS